MRTLYFLLAWFILIVFLSVRGAIEAAQPAPIGIAVALLIPIGLYFIDRRWLGSVIFSGFGSLSRETLVVIQTYRAIPGVLFLVEVAKSNLAGGFGIPAGVGDVLVGLLAPWVAWSFFKRKAYAGKLLVFWNVLGLFDLVLANSLGVLFSDSPLGTFAGALTSQEVIRYPLCLIPTWLVPISILLHIRSLQNHFEEERYSERIR